MDVKQYKGFGPLSIWFWIVIVTLIRVAYLWFNHRPLGIEEAQYWSWSTHLAWGYHSKGPLIAWVIKLSTLMNGVSAIGVRFFVPFMYALSSFMVYYTAHRLYNDERISFYSALTFLLLPAVTFSSTTMTTDPLLLMCWSIALYTFVEAEATNHWKMWFVCGLAVGLGLLAKYTMIVFAISLAFYLVIHRRDLFARKGLYGATAIAVLILLPNLIWNATHHWVTFDHVGGHNVDLQAAGLHWSHLGNFVGSQFAVAGPIGFALLLFYLCRPRWAFQTEGGKLLFWQIVPLLAAITIESLMSRAYANWTAPIFIAASIYIAAGLLRKRRAWLLIVACVINVLMALTLYTYEISRAYGVVSVTKHVKVDPFKRNRPWPALGSTILQVQMNHPGANFLFDNRAILSESLFYGRIPLDNAFIYNPSGSLLSQYDLPTRLKKGDSFFYVTDKKNPTDIESHFAQHKLYTQLAIRELKHYQRFYIFSFKDFRGYE